MKKFRIFEYLYLAFAAVFLTEAVLAYKAGGKKFFLLLLFSIIALLLYIYRKLRRIKQEKNTGENK